MHCCLRVEQQPLPQLVLIKLPVLICQVPAYDRMGDGSREGMAFKRAPAAFIIDILFCYGGGLLQVNDHAISMVSFADVTSFFDPEAGGGCMAHLFHHFFYGKT